MLHAKLKIYGLVQGVTFRYSAKKVADEFNIVGFVKNEKDGSVSIEAEGDEYDLKKFVDWCRCGPQKARVDLMDVEYGKELKNYKKFESLHKK